MKLLRRLVFVFHIYWKKEERNNSVIQAVEGICQDTTDTIQNINLSALTHLLIGLTILVII